MGHYLWLGILVGLAYGVKDRYPHVPPVKIPTTTRECTEPEYYECHEASIKQLLHGNRNGHEISTAWVILIWATAATIAIMTIAGDGEQL